MTNCPTDFLFQELGKNSKEPEMIIFQMRSKSGEEAIFCREEFEITIARKKTAEDVKKYCWTVIKRLNTSWLRFTN